MKKKLLVLLITAIPMLMPNLASAVVIDVGGMINLGGDWIAGGWSTK